MLAVIGLILLILALVLGIMNLMIAAGASLAASIEIGRASCRERV